MNSSAATHNPDRTGRARIRDAAIARFARHGVAGTSMQTIAGDAGVSAPLVVHHYGSKDDLRRACDRHVAATIREQKQQVVAQGAAFDPLAALRRDDGDPPIMRYLARTLADSTPEVAELVDELVDDAVDYMEEGVRTGMIRPSEHHRERAIVLTMWSLGALVLHDHLERLLGVDLYADGTELAPYMLPAAEILSRGVLSEEIYQRFRDALAPEEGPS